MAPPPLRSQFTRLCLGIVVCFMLAGCGDTCVVVLGIFPNDKSSSTTQPACKLGGGTGTIIVGVSRASAPTTGPTMPNLRHIFVTIRGIEAHTSALADENSLGWQELAPDLAATPIQIDLMAPSSVSPLCSPHSIEKTRVRVGVYRVIRLRLVSDPAAGGESASQQNSCNEIGPNCIVDNTGQQHPLAFKTAMDDFVITSDHIDGGFFNVLPDTQSHLSIVFDPYSSLALPPTTQHPVQVVPAFSASSNATCDSSSSPTLSP